MLILNASYNAYDIAVAKSAVIALIQGLVVPLSIALIICFIIKVAFHAIDERHNEEGGE